MPVGRAQEFGLQHVMHVRGVRRVALHEAVLAMLLGKSQVPGGVEGDDETPVQPGRIERLAANEPLQHQPTQTRVRRGRMEAVTLEEMMQRFVDRPRLLLGLGEAIEVGEDFAVAAIQGEVELPSLAHDTPFAVVQPIVVTVPPSAPLIPYFSPSWMLTELPTVATVSALPIICVASGMLVASVAPVVG